MEEEPFLMGFVPKKGLTGCNANRIGKLTSILEAEKRAHDFGSLANGRRGVRRGEALFETNPTKVSNDLRRGKKRLTGVKELAFGLKTKAGALGLIFEVEAVGGAATRGIPAVTGAAGGTTTAAFCDAGTKGTDALALASNLAFDFAGLNGGISAMRVEEKARRDVGLTVELGRL